MDDPEDLAWLEGQIMLVRDAFEAADELFAENTPDADTKARVLLNGLIPDVRARLNQRVADGKAKDVMNEYFDQLAATRNVQ